MRYEYTLWTLPMTALWLDGTPTSLAQQLAGNSERLLLPLSEQLGSDGWEPISHDVLKLEDGAILSILLRRPLPDPDSHTGSAS